MLPHSEQNRLLLLARFATRKSGITLAESDRVLRDLFDVAVRVRTLFDATSAVMAVATLLLCMTVVALTVRLRRSEVTTMSRIGLSSVRIGLLFGFELLFVILVAAGIAALLVTASDAAGPWIFERLVQ